MDASDLLFSAIKFAYEYTVQFQALLAEEEVIRIGLPGGQSPEVPDSEEIPTGDTTTIPRPDRAPLIGGHSQDPGHITVGIIGAGAAGLYTAMILDSLGIKYEILESSERSGGRILTHRFSEGGKWDYFDVGAMRLPDIPIMFRVFDLIRNRLDLKDKLLTYYLTDPKKNQILDYNSIRVRQKDIQAKNVGDAQVDHFMDSDKHGGAVPNDYVSRGLKHWLDECFEPFKKVFVDSGWDAGYKFLMKYDLHSVRSFMRTAVDDAPIKKGAYPDLAINWLERMAGGTGSFNLALSEMVIANLTFDYPTAGLSTYGFDDPSCQEKQWNWFCLAGGTEVLTDAMKNKIKYKPLTRKRVTSISPTFLWPAGPNEDIRTEMDPAKTEPFPFRYKPMTVTTTDAQGRSATNLYDYVISTIPLSNLRLVNMDMCNLTYLQKEGIRMLDYGASCKVGLKFKTRWWQDRKDIGIVGGQSKTDRPVRTVVYPSYGVEDPKADAVMIASYSWDQDAHRIGALIHGHDTLEEKILMDTVLADLSAIHLVPMSFLREELVDFFSWNWYSNPHSIGAFAHFSPAQFKLVYPALTEPAAAGRLVFAGEALSSQHGWIEGALKSSARAVKAVLRCGGYNELLDKVEKEWKDKGLPKGEAEKWEELMEKQAVYGSLLSVGIPSRDTKSL